MFKLKKHIKHCNFHFEDLYDMVFELMDGENEDLETMILMTKAIKKNNEKISNLEKKVELLTTRFDLWKDIHRENMMLLMEYLGVYLDIENDKKVIKKNKKKNKKK